MWRQYYIVTGQEFPGEIYPVNLAIEEVVHTRHSRWSKKGIWEMIFQHLAKDSDREYQMIDATIVRAHQHSAGAKNSDKKRCDPAAVSAARERAPRQTSVSVVALAD